MTDYVTWAPGAQVTPHVGGALGTLCAQCRRLRQGSQGHAMCPWSTVPLVHLRNGRFRLFRAFPAFPSFSADSGGPTLPFGQESTERSKVARMATLRLLAIWEHPWYPWIQTAKGGLGPYSWPPELASSLARRVPGGHTAHFPEMLGSRVF